MESPVVIDKPPEYHGNARDNERGFPFDEEEGSGAWSELAARHPDIAARLRQRPATWARKRRPSSQDATDDFGESFSGFDRFPFDDIPQEFREHFPTHWNRRFSGRDEPDRAPPAAAPRPPSPPRAHSPHHSTAATQTDRAHQPAPEPSHAAHHTHLPQYGLRNTVDLGQRSPADPSLVDADDRNQRSMSAPPDSCTQNQSATRMNAQNHQEAHLPPHAEQPQQASNVRHIPIFVEGRDEPVINKSDHGTHFGDSKPTYVPPPQPHVDREQYYDDGPAFHAPPNFSRAFGTPFNKGFRQGPQPFVQQKVYPQTAFARGASPQRSQSPKPQSPQMHPEEPYVKVPVQHEHAPKPEPRPQHKPAPPPHQQHQQQQHQHQQHQHPPQHQHPAPPKQQTPPPQPKPQEKQTPSSNDPITQILSIQTDVLNLMSEVENFTGTKKDKRYLFLDEMLTRNLIKLDNIETEGKENIRQARKEAIKCIQKCIAVLEAKADKGSRAQQPQEVDMNENAGTTEPVTENGEVEMKEAPKEEEKVEPQAELQPNVESQENKEGPTPDTVEAAPAADTQAADTRPDETKPAEPEQKKDQEGEQKESPKKGGKGGKNVKKRDKSKDNKDKDSNKEQTENKEDTMLVDEKGDKTSAQAMEIDGAASQ